eukprot:tig00020902_g14980.t1
MVPTSVVPTRASSSMTPNPIEAPQARRQLYPPIECYDSGFLQARHGQELARRPRRRRRSHSGAPGGLRRGCGKSVPHACLENNTTWHLVEDIEALRRHLNVERWLLFGGSWGSTLALAYAEVHPERVTEMILRGVFLLRQRELHWFYESGGGASTVYPDAFERFVELVPPAERSQSIISAYHRMLVTGTDDAMRQRAAKAWSVWEGTTSRLMPDPISLSRFSGDAFSLAFARIECHYFQNKGFFRSDNQLLEEAHRVAHVPTIIVQGRYDVICPTISAYELHKALPRSSLRIVQDAGHSAFEPGMVHELITATDAFRYPVPASSYNPSPTHQQTADSVQ